MVVSIDPRRVYLAHPNGVEFKTVRVRNPGKLTMLTLNLVAVEILFCSFTFPVWMDKLVWSST